MSYFGMEGMQHEKKKEKMKLNHNCKKLPLKLKNGGILY